MLAEGMGKVQCRLKRLVVPSGLLTEKSQGRLQLCSWLKLISNRNWITCGQSFPRDHSMQDGLDCSGHLSELPPAPFLSLEPVEVQHYNSVSRDICKVSRTFPFTGPSSRAAERHQVPLMAVPEPGLLRPSNLSTSIITHGTNTVRALNQKER